VTSNCRMESKDEDIMLTNVQPIWEEKLQCGWIAVDDLKPDDSRVLGAGYPTTAPHSRDQREGGGDDQPKPKFGNKEVSKLHKHSTRQEKSASKSAKQDIPSTWWEFLVGLAGWWRRVELENDKLDNERRKLEEIIRRKEENKLESLRKFYPNISTTPKGSERLRSGKKNLTDLEHPT
jgi:hypothetical protein